MKYQIKKYEITNCPQLEADEKKREHQTFFNPYCIKVLEGGSFIESPDVELIAILSSN